MTELVQSYFYTLWRQVMNEGVVEPDTGTHFTTYVRKNHCRGFQICSTCEILATDIAKASNEDERESYKRALAEHHAEVMYSIFLRVLCGRAIFLLSHHLLPCLCFCFTLFHTPACFLGHDRLTSLIPMCVVLLLRFYFCCVYLCDMNVFLDSHHFYPCATFCFCIFIIPACVFVA